MANLDLCARAVPGAASKRRIRHLDAMMIRIPRPTIRICTRSAVPVLRALRILPCSILKHVTNTTAEPSAELTLPVVGMTCASCVNRIERFLNRADGVAEANVNLATERATVRFDPALIDRTGIVATIEAAGYEVGREASAAIGTDAADAAEEAERAAERRELLTGAIV